MRPSAAVLVVPLLLAGVRGDDCQPWTWPGHGLRKRDAGDIVCRHDAVTGPDVNYYTCKELADRYGTLIDTFQLNPSLDRDCKTIRPNTMYCVKGCASTGACLSGSKTSLTTATDVQPAQAINGLCGPQHNNASCVGIAAQCYNSETWRCGNSA